MNQHDEIDRLFCECSADEDAHQLAVIALDKHRERLLDIYKSGAPDDWKEARRETVRCLLLHQLKAILNPDAGDQPGDDQGRDQGAGDLRREPRSVTRAFGPEDAIKKPIEATLSYWVLQTEVINLRADNEALTAKLAEVVGQLKFTQEELTGRRRSADAEAAEHARETFKLKNQNETASQQLRAVAEVALPAIQFWLAVSAALGEVGQPVEQWLKEQDLREMVSELEKLVK